MTAPSEITDLIKSSGNNFHAKVARWFADNGWHVVISPYYMDQTQSKAREIDLVAEKLWPLTDAPGRPVDNIARPVGDHSIGSQVTTLPKRGS
ncbi:MAG: hypothetical protein ACK5NY_04970 [Burkholderiaceae bacterium]